MADQKRNQITLQDRLNSIDYFQAQRFAKLEGDALETVKEGIIRHLRACARMEVNPDGLALKELIDDALSGRGSFAENAEESRVS
ncbi:MAG TPA: hypothetical protein VK308_14555 [Pyrinomonadaceae bacterium]|nr:hypothetical protein [Pyrinomonadaceae bacterium]